MKTRILSFFVLLCFIFAASVPVSFSKGKDSPKKASVGLVKSTETAKMDSTSSKTMHAHGNKNISKTHGKKHSLTMKNKTTKKDTSSTKRAY